MQRLTPLSNRQFVALGLVAMAVVGAVHLGQVIVSEDYRQLALVLAFGLGGISSLFILRDWRMGVVLFFVWAVFEDLLRKYLGNNMLVYALKDGLILAAYASYLLAIWQKKEPTVKNPLGGALLVFVIWVLIETLNPYIENYLVPILGLRMTLLYVPLLYLGQNFFQRENQLRNFWCLMLAVAALTSCLGVTQTIVGLDFLSPKSSPFLRLQLTRYAPESLARVPRPTATFVDAGRFAQYMFVMAFVGLGIVAYLYGFRGRKERSLRWLAWACWATIVTGLFLSGQRSSILWLVLSLGVMAVLHIGFRMRLQKGVHAFPLGRVLFAGAAVLLFAAFLMPERFGAAYDFYAETLNPSSPYAEYSTRPQSHLRSTVFAWEQSGLIGHGTGSSSLGLQYVAPLLPEEEAYKFRDQIEGGYAVVLWEWGVVGLVLWLWWSLVLLKAMVQIVRKLRGTHYFWLGTTISLCIFCILFPSFSMGMQIYQNYLTQAFLWFLMGLLFRLPELAAQGPEAAFGVHASRAIPPRAWPLPAPLAVRGARWR